MDNNTATDDKDVIFHAVYYRADWFFGNAVWFCVAEKRENNKANIMKRLISFFILAYAISWVIWMPLWLPAFGIDGLPVLPYHHALGGLGPMLAACIMTYRENGKEGLKKLINMLFAYKPLLYLIIAFFSPFIILLVASVADTIINNNAFSLMGFTKSKEFPEFSFVSFLLYKLIFFGYGEETGCRSYALPRLQQRYSPIKAVLLLTIGWMIWHGPLFLYRPGYTQMDITGIMGWIFSMLTGSVLLAWLFNASKGNILVVAMFHATIDIAFTADVSNTNVVNYAGAMITIWGLVMLLVLRKQKPVIALLK